ncbi:uncharacterized protein [Littorina saxatilis]|uniref:uncharacterized protein n=1 Tax=Littorina saxatilis TaxID=31220 RepID=UPI0038B4B2EC
MQRTKQRSMANRREAQNNKFWAVSIFLIVSIMCGLGNCAPRKCLHGKTYLDKFTHRRECCADICEHAKIRRTEEDCKNNCPDYPEPPKPAEMIDKMLDKQEDDPLSDDTPSTKPDYTTLITVLITALVVIVVVVIVVLVLYVKRGSCARVLPGGQAEQRNHNDDGFEMTQAEQRRQENGNRPIRGPLGNDEAYQDLLHRQNGVAYDRGYGQMDDWRDDQMANRHPILNGFNGTVTEAHQQNGDLGRVVVAAAQLHQQPGDVDARRRDQDRAAAAAREAQPLRRPINETGDGDRSLAEVFG